MTRVCSEIGACHSKKSMPDTKQSRLPMRFDGQVALVPGAGSGIGRALVQRFVAEGASVVAADIVEAPLHALVKELQEQGGKAVGCVANVASETDTQRMLDTAVSTYRRLGILCNNAGLMDSMTRSAHV